MRSGHHLIHERIHRLPEVVVHHWEGSVRVKRLLKARLRHKLRARHHLIHSVAIHVGIVESVVVVVHAVLSELRDRLGNFFEKRRPQAVREISSWWSLRTS